MMMMGEATGKGLNVKGKSARKGVLSGFVPFVQIHKQEHKKLVGTPPAHARIKIFYRSRANRELAAMELGMVLGEMTLGPDSPGLAP